MLLQKQKPDAKIIELESTIKKVVTFESSYFRGKNYFDEAGTPNYLIFVPIFKSFKANATSHILLWKSKGLSNETIKPTSTSDNSLTPLINYIDRTNKIRIKFTRSCLKQSKLSYTHKKVVSIYVVYELGASSSNVNDPTLKKLFI